MPAGKHKGVRVALSVPEGIYNQLDQWAEAEGRPIASLCMSLVEQGVRQGVIDGICPSVMQTKENDPYLNTKPGVTAHQVHREEKEEAKESDLYSDLSSKDKKNLIQALLSSMMNEKE